MTAKLIQSSDEPDQLFQDTLYFSGWGYDDRQLAAKPFAAGYALGYDPGADVLVVEVDGQGFILRKMEETVCFRKLEDTEERSSLVLLKPALPGWHVNTIRLWPERFAKYYSKQEYGRCLLYRADFMKPHQCLFMCFAPDGSGFCLESTGERLVNLRWQETTLLQWRELLIADPEKLKPLCNRIFEEQVNPHIVNKYLAPLGSTRADFVNEPHQFLCGSEAELRRITAYIVQTEPGVFDSKAEPVTVTYWAQTWLHRPDRVRVEPGRNWLGQTRLLSLCHLTLRLNNFVGVRWGFHAPAPNRIAHLQAEAWKIKVVVNLPTARERAEALLSLSEWLDGKVSEQEKRELLQLPDDVEI